jgi:hypothetical protein
VPPVLLTVINDPLNLNVYFPFTTLVAITQVTERAKPG